ncbi:hypothetical protein BCP78_0127 [Bacillus phage BCP78]|uniref:WDGH domain-containing protein n=3 Tax=Tsarbombavirus BCP78 TaxID=1985182 RepID=J9PQN3_9CAUD|nr:hypothetical protein BCP78_0127 [Bacillus phage BCP78]YP_009783490.1 hypothetical protein QLX27_gp117 [Bacillus phage BCU4]AEW47134.1 hypothetical protein BCP78_0127 [Bacillus phage BCP78]AEW47623.1 hypothetical protein BCU4_0117 [Bacillus phage BCU4]AQN32506.1 hypothetical protein BCP12_088 [Bacillus phage BCP12]
MTKFGVFLSGELMVGGFDNIVDAYREAEYCTNESGVPHEVRFDIPNGQISDGSHTFDELYYHRMILFSVICNLHKEKAWKSWKHDDGTMFDDYFIVGIETPQGQFTYHYHKDHWDKFEVEELAAAPAWDGHTSDDITRLLSL